MSDFNKIAVLGIDGVGKSSLISQFVQNQFPSELDSTIEKCYEKTTDKGVKVDILDTSSQKDSALFKNTPIDSIACIIIVFALDDRSTFEAVQHFLTDIENLKPKREIPIIVCGNKSDVENRKIGQIEAYKYFNDYKSLYFETSAKTNSCVEEIFSNAIELTIDSI